MEKGVTLSSNDSTIFWTPIPISPARERRPYGHTHTHKEKELCELIMNSTFWLELLPIWINWMLLNLISHWPYATIQQQCDRWCDAANSSDVWVGLSSIFCCSFYFISFVVLISASRYNYNMMRSNTPKPLITDSRADASESALAFNMQCSLFLSLSRYSFVRLNERARESA